MLFSEQSTTINWKLYNRLVTCVPKMRLKQRSVVDFIKLFLVGNVENQFLNFGEIEIYSKKVL